MPPEGIDPSALSKFQNLNFGNDDSIAHLSGDENEITSSGTHHKLGNVFRDDDDKAENNRIRTELLKSLGQALGLSGVSEKDGVVTFSSDFMDKLEELLGKDVLHRDSFGIDGELGTVTSGKPLTQRRLTAIIDKTKLYTEADDNQGFYRQKLDIIRGELDAKVKAIKLESINQAIEEFAIVEKCIDFLDKENETVAPDKSLEQKEQEAQKVSRKNEKLGQDAGRSAAGAGSASQSPLLESLRQYTGLTFSKQTSATLASLEGRALQKHIQHALLAYVRLSCNAYSSALRHGCLEQLTDRMRKTGHDIDLRMRKLIEFEAELRSR